jgi:hypothetical protein
MPVSFSLQNSTNFIRPFLKNQPATVMGMEPGLDAGNLVLQMMLAPPLRWRFNRRTFQFQTAPPATDYQLPLPDFGFLETQWIVDSNGKTHAMNGATALGVDSMTSRPTEIAAQYDDDQGNITFRVKNTPDAIYTVNGDYQRRPSLMQSYASTWDVVPDDFSHCYHLGFLTFMSLLVNDSRFPIFEKWFLSRVLSSQDGLDDQARDIFLGNWMSGIRTVTRTQGMAQSGNAARGT